MVRPYCEYTAKALTRLRRKLSESGPMLYYVPAAAERFKNAEVARSGRFFVMGVATNSSSRPGNRGTFLSNTGCGKYQLIQGCIKFIHYVTEANPLPDSLSSQVMYLFLYAL